MSYAVLLRDLEIDVSNDKETFPRTAYLNIA